MVGQNVCTINFRKIQSAATPLVMVLGLTALMADPVEARQPKQKIDNTHCVCQCNSFSGGDLLEYPNPGTCGALNGKTCNIEVNQGGVVVVRSGTLATCGPRIIMRLQTIPDLGPMTPVRTR
jgi:hypothetical protein